MAARPTVGAGYARSLERRLDVTLFDRAGLVLEPAAAAGLVRAALSLADRNRAEAVVAAAERTAAQRPEHASLVAAASHARRFSPATPTCSSGCCTTMPTTTAHSNSCREPGPAMSSSTRVVERSAFGWDSLTDTERRVVDLAIEGLANREIAAQMFLSPHTIAFHLRQVFRKLGIRSRVQLARQRLESSVTVTHEATQHKVAQ